MISLRAMRGTRIIQRCLPHCRREGSAAYFALRTPPPVAHNGSRRSTASIGSWTSGPGSRSIAVSGSSIDDFRVATSSSATAVVLHQRRHLSGRSGEGVRGRRPTDKRKTSSDSAKDSDGKATYTFLGQDDLGQLSSESKGKPKTDTAESKVQASGKDGEEDVDSANVTMWQRWKNTRAKMKLLWKQYGLVWIGTFTVLYIGMLGGVYVVLDTGLVASDVDTSAAIRMVADQLGAQNNPTVMWLQMTIETNPKANTLLKAVIVNEFLEFPRDIVAIAATPSIARAIGRAPPKS
ncbi:unnamed protein product [Pylaiella littoralis]